MVQGRVAEEHAKTSSKPRRRAAVLVLPCLLLALWLGATAAPAQPVELAAPYEYMGWGDPQPTGEVLGDSGLHALTLAFILARGRATRSGTAAGR